MSTCTALIIPANPTEPARVETTDTGLETLQGLVGGNIEAVSFEDWHSYLNEEGKILGLAPNRRAGLLILAETGGLSDVYCGDVIVLGETSDGGEGNVPESLLDLAEKLFGIHRTTT
uniref:DUF3846 domain-containing protein n=1 Tax=Paenarthrobacter ureafaciens TaxID=37931 RepID=UPI003F4977B4